MILNSSSSIPLYVQLSEMLEKKILNHEYQPGDKLLTESVMAKKYGVSVITVRNAVGELVDKGMLERKQGKGTFVTKAKYLQNMKKLQSFSDMCRQMGVAPGSKVLEKRIVRSDKKAADALKIERGSEIVFIRRLRFADDEPVQVENLYFPIRYAGLLEEDFKSLFETLNEKYDVRVAASEKIIELCRATRDEARLMNMKENDALLLIKSTAYDEKGDILYAASHVVNGDKFSLYVYENNGER